MPSSPGISGFSLPCWHHIVVHHHHAARQGLGGIYTNLATYMRYVTLGHVTSIEITHKYITNLYIERDVAIDRTQPGT